MVKTQKGIGVSMKKYKTMVILLVVFVVLLGLYFVMQYVNKLQTDNGQDETIMVTELQNLSTMEYTNGETIVSFTNNEGVWALTDNNEINLDSIAVDAIANTLSKVQASRVLSGADELSSYGLEEPVYTITLKTEAGAEVTLYIGNSVEGDYYATTGDLGVVYVIGSSAVDALEFDISALEVQEESTEDTATENTTTE